MEDKRSQARHDHKADAYLELFQDGKEGDYISQVISCETIDLSPAGLKIYLSEPVPQGLVTDILVEINGEEGRYFLSAEVKWISPCGDDGWYLAGFEIYPRDNTDYQGWVEMLAQRELRKGNG